jgi:hypothetical protein
MTIQIDPTHLVAGVVAVESTLRVGVHRRTGTSSICP